MVRPRMLKTTSAARSSMSLPVAVRARLSTRSSRNSRILLAGDYPFHGLDAAAIAGFLETLPDPDDRQRIAHADAEALYGLAASAEDATVR
jgi:uncharacterized protein